MTGCDGCNGGPETDAAVPFDTIVVPPDAFVAVAELTITPALAEFGDIVVGQSSTATEFEIENVGTGTSSALSATFGGSGAGDYAFASNDCAGQRLEPGDTCTISVTFRPGDTGGSSATLTVAGGDASAVATLSGNGAEDAGLSISPSPHNFGDVIVSDMSAPQTFTVTNTGDATSGTITISVGGLDSTQFTLGADTCSDTTIDAGETCTVEVVYAPTSSGTHMGTVQASASPGSTATAALQGRAATEADLRLRPGAQDFGSVVTGTSSTDVTFTLENIGGVASGLVPVA
ncbi:MAG: choice-of-anchor D domain-containing protein [Deltaproteobacteria bacterium]|nr:choice-of-anchor D domain-containing protein [Deltaproteobacteria bacterium]